MHEVCRAVERIDDPLILVIAFRAAFLGQNGMFGVVVFYDLDDRFLGLLIDLGHKVVVALLGDRERLQVIELANHQRAGAARCLDCDVDHAVHQVAQRKEVLASTQCMSAMEIPVRIVLVEPTHPGNIGAVARAMKTMGLADLVLVRPRRFPDDEAVARASGADDVLAAARVCASLEEAIEDCGFVVGTSARVRAVPCPIVTPRHCAELITAQTARTQTAVLLGTESSGLTNEQMGFCRYLVNIPANAAYSSLNLAMATQIICYEIRMAMLGDAVTSITDERGDEPATAAELEGLHAHLERVLDGTGFFNPDHPKTMRLRLRRLFQRAELDRTEVNILRGALAALDPDRRRRGESKD